MRNVLLAAVACVAVGFLLGLVILGDEEPTAIELAMQQAELDFRRSRNELALSWTRAMNQLAIGFGAALAVVVVVSFAGAGYCGVHYLGRRAAAIPPNDEGVYPLVVLKMGPALLFYNPNPPATLTAVYAQAEDGAVPLAPSLSTRFPGLRFLKGRDGQLASLGLSSPAEPGQAGEIAASSPAGDQGREVGTAESPAEGAPGPTRGEQATQKPPQPVRPPLPQVKVVTVTPQELERLFEGEDSSS